MTITNRVLDLAIRIQQIPSPTFDERQRASYVQDLFAAENLSDVEIDAIGNVYGRLPGEGTERPLVITAHSDTVFPKIQTWGSNRKPIRFTDLGSVTTALGWLGFLAYCGIYASGT